MLGKSVLLDTGFLISFVDRSRANHEIAQQYFEKLCKDQILIYLSTIVVSEYCVRSVLSVDLLKVMRILNFDYFHAQETARLSELILRDSPNSRAEFINDLKIIAQAAVEKIPFILTEDKDTLAKYCARYSGSNIELPRPIVLADGFDLDAFSNIPQRSLFA
jgi:predicted nucleic acid-binding protein